MVQKAFLDDSYNLLTRRVRVREHVGNPVVELWTAIWSGCCGGATFVDFETAAAAAGRFLRADPIVESPNLAPE